MNTEKQWPDITPESRDDAQTERSGQALEAAGAIAVTYSRFPKKWHRIFLVIL